MMRRRKYPRLWHSEDDEDSSRRSGNEELLDHDSSTTELMHRFSSRPEKKSLLFVMSNCIVVGQEFALTCLLLRYWVEFLREEQKEYRLDRLNYSTYTINDKDIDQRRMTSMFLVYAALLMMIFFSEFGGKKDSTSAKEHQKQQKQQHHHQQPRREKFRTRATDALLLAGIIRLIASVLRSLTASYSSDTVYALAVSGMIIHLFTCDYSYANGRAKAAQSVSSSFATQRRRPAFLGGTMSLNAALFSTTLLASRLESNVTAYFFISSSIILFAFYPATRHAISTQPSSTTALLLITTSISIAFLVLLDNVSQRICFVFILVIICVIVPIWKFLLQRHKVFVSGPWDIARISQSDLKATAS